jgi:hypothetical protein
MQTIRRLSRSGHLFSDGALVAGAGPALIGLKGDVWVLWEWAASGFGPLNKLRTSPTTS